ncbi:LicD family protein [Bifidobacterium sp. ESL0682]|uniref:LicD family protein n=1 Tax=Bifidobacterium sp. ESL0682 TaxID=2983212 RepID=UPI0023FA38A4|nr:LicD family protein [Bifidobacterium sp. ESL0682]WEV42235.1 LicD family protein [Bifidobacterium sp. ESL0682]
MADRKQELTTSEIKAAILDILKSVIQICDDQRLTYYLAYGSLIGALRHQGFIPWDDDLDIWMPRPDYDKLLQYFDDSQHDTGSLVALHTTEQRLLPFLLTRISDTRYKEIGEYGDLVPEMGTFIDIYPLDGLLGNYEEALEDNEKTFSIVAKYMKAANFPTINRPINFLKEVLKKLRSMMMKSPITDWREICSRSTVKGYEDAEYVSCKTWNDAQSCKVVDRKDDYGEGKMAIFEGLQVRIPDNTDAILRRIYGDYMQLPPESERVGHHYYSIVPREDA